MPEPLDPECDEMKTQHDFLSPWRLAAGVALPLLLGLLLRLYALGQLFLPIGDSLIYGDIARNLLRHGQYALTATNGEVYSTLIRLPGYPFLLAACFRIFGMENYFFASCLQIALELAGCLLLADFVRRVAPATLALRAACIALWLSCLCPFTASYTATPLAETPTLFAIVLALWSMAVFRHKPSWVAALSFILAITFAALLRPDGALVAVALAPAALLGLPRGLIQPARLARIATVCALLALTPFALWTARNWKTFKVFQPLAPHLANDPDEDPHLGWESWIKSWCLDFNCTYNVYWNVPGGDLALGDLPRWAFDSPAQQAETAALAADYNRTHELTHAFDLRFAQLAAERATAHPWRTRLGLPLGRLGNMWFSPRTENLPLELDWWNSAAHPAETRVAWALVALNLLYLALGVAGLWLRPRFWPAMLAYILLRSLMLTTVQAPETRYTLECFPMLFALGSVALAAFWNRWFSGRAAGGDSRSAAA
jgi:hypothetical protein